MGTFFPKGTARGQLIAMTPCQLCDGHTCIPLREASRTKRLPGRTPSKTRPLREACSGEVREASLLGKSGSGRGCRPFAFVGATPVSSTAALSLPPWSKSGYTDAKIQVALSFDEEDWFPSFKRTGCWPKISCCT